ncbi:MAG: gamma-glutamyltransferase family protein [Chloroflexi bacterium]|nr:gamma-glutamyltransferase family protein [Chloroflexota bacterium]
MPDPTRSEWLIAKTEATAARAMATTDQPAATDAAVRVMREGGNAVDAAVTAAFAMGVAEPALSGIGGVAVVVIRTPDGRETVIDGSGLAPAAARADMFRIAAGSDVKGMYGWPAAIGDENNVGYRSVGAPGMVAAMALALERYGTIGLERAVRPAVALASEGLPVDIFQTLTFASYADRLWEFPESKRTFFKKDGLPLHPPTALEGGGDRLVQADLARSLELIGREGPDAFYRGPLARAIVEDVRRGGGILALEDLAAYEAREVPALVTEHRGHRVATNAGCGGGITVAEMLNILDGYPLEGMDRSSAEYVHLVGEACRRSFIDRIAYLGDPDQVDAPFDVLASMEHAAHVRSEIDPARATPERGPRVRGRATRDVPHTTHMCAVDASGMCVSLTSTLGGAFGSAAVIRGTGILLANVMTWFDPRPGRPNSIAGRKRILWAPSPAIVSRAGEPVLAIGASGGRRLISAVAQGILNVVRHGDGPQDAVNGLRVHYEGGPMLVDTRVPERERERLGAMGHSVVPTEESIASAAFGRSNGILIEKGRLRGGVGRVRPSVAAGS